MSERFKIEKNLNESKNTRLPVAQEFSNYRFGRDALAHVSRYLLVIERIIARAKEKKRPLTWLDIGCGDAYLPKILTASFRVRKEDIIKNYVGLDIDPVSLQRARRGAPKCFPILFECGDITDGALAKYSNFDIITCLEVLEHIKPKFVASVLKELKRLGAELYLSTPNFSGGSGKLPADHIKEWGAAELQELLQEQGFLIKKKIGTFSNLPKVATLAKKSAGLDRIYKHLKDKLDNNFLSIIMARFIGDNAQNILYICE